MSKKLSILKPDVREGYFKHLRTAPEGEEGQESIGREFGRSRDRESYRILHISPDSSRKVLEDDIKAGAVQFRPCLDYLKGPASGFIVIECDTEEEGLSAVTYMAGASDELYYTEEENGEDDVMPFEYDNNIPVIDINEITSYECTLQASESNQYMNAFQLQKDSHDPYWTDYSGSVCIVDRCLVDDDGNIALINHDGGPVFYPSMSTQDNTFRWHKYFNRFIGDGSCIYYILVRDTALKGLFEDKKKQQKQECEDMCFSMYKAKYDEDFSLSSLILKYTAEVIDLNAKVSEKENYYTLLFKSWVQLYGFKLEKRFPLRRILHNICRIDSKPSQVIQSILKYVRHKYPQENTLCREFFSQTGVLKNVMEKTADKNPDREVTVGDLVGMEDVKRQFENIIDAIKFSRERENKGLPVLEYRNIFMLIGAPGTAKTTMANILGKRMKQEHLLGGTRFGSFSGAQLKGEFVGQTAPKVHQIFESNDIIIIDEAYSLTASDNGGMDTYSQEALAQLAIELENHGKDRLVFFAGYGGDDVTGRNNKMKEFLDANPGIKSRINGTIVFPSYDVEQMTAIVSGIAGRYGFRFEESALELIRNYFEKRVRDVNFGNGREARSFVDNCQMTMAERIMKLPRDKRTRKMMQIITLADVDATIGRLESSQKSQIGASARYGFV